MEHRLSALLQLDLRYRLNARLQRIEQRQLQDDRRNLYVLEFGVLYKRFDGTCFTNLCRTPIVHSNNNKYNKANIARCLSFITPAVSCYRWILAISIGFTSLAYGCSSSNEVTTQDIVNIGDLLLMRTNKCCIDKLNKTNHGNTSWNNPDFILIRTKCYPDKWNKINPGNIWWENDEFTLMRAKLLPRQIKWNIPWQHFVG